MLFEYVVSLLAYFARKEDFNSPKVQSLYSPDKLTVSMDSEQENRGSFAK